MAVVSETTTGAHLVELVEVELGETQREPEVAKTLKASATEKGSFATTGKKEHTQRPNKHLVSVAKLYSYADHKDMLVMALGSFGAVLAGLCMPFFMLQFGKTVDKINDPSASQSIVNRLVIGFVVAGIINFCGGFLMMTCWAWAGERIALRIKRAYVRSVLRQDIGWFDVHPPGQLPTLVTVSMAKIQDGVGHKVSDIIMNLTTFIGAFIVAFVLNPVLAAVLLACLPLIVVSVGLVARLMSKSSIEGDSHYGKAGAVANEVLAGIRTIASLGAERYQGDKYSSQLEGAEKAGIQLGIRKGMGHGLLYTFFFLSYALAFWFGTKQVADDLANNCTSNCITGGKVISTIFAVLIGARSLGQTQPGVAALNLARSAGVLVFETIDRVPPIDAFSDDGVSFDNAQGALELREVGFSYPARPDDLVYHSISLSIAVGETLALVGPSGGGKSTMTKLLLRFYDPTSGCLMLDGHDIRELNVRWYRSQIGYVGQEPVLFSGTVRENIANGKPGCEEKEIIDAAKKANAHNFITAFPQGYDTPVGEAGVQVSGGQKQRIAIARAIIKDPAILLLDEATSALDSESEKVVQSALDNLHRIKKRTTITIAHRLSTIQNSDRIAVVGNKGIAEIGTHTELLEMGGIYAALCATQAGQTEEERKNEELLRSVRESSSTAGGRALSFASGNNRFAASSQVLHRASSSRGMSGEVLKMPSDAESMLEQEEQRKKDEAKLPKPPMKRLWGLSKPEMPQFAAGMLGALVLGAVFPTEGVLIANLQSNLYKTDPNVVRTQGDRWALGFLVLAVAILFGSAIHAWGFAVFGNRLTRRLRDMTFRAFLRRDIGWFDEEEHGTGVLTARLENDASKVYMATAMTVANTSQVVTTLLVGVLIGLISCWQIGLVAMCLVPLMAFASIMQFRMLNGSYNGNSEGLDGGVSAGVILGGALNGVTTVQAFNMQSKVDESYAAAIAGTIKRRQRQGALTGLAFGYSQAMMFLVFALLFWYGSKLIKQGKVNFHDFFQALFAVILGAFGVGHINTEMSDTSEGQQAAARIFKLVDEPLKIDPLSEEGAKPVEVKGAVSFKGVKFAYPNRPHVQIYGSPRFPQGFNLEVKAGQTVALVGPSGCGKSTSIQLLLRFYDTSAGEVRLDGRDIRSLNLPWYRSQLGYVGQEPVLFTGTIRDNILLGKLDATQEEIEAAARMANAHDFIMSFGKGYDTDIGEKSMLLSGGQKQRVAIARAIIKDPAVLILDEATAALDNESERQVQEALDHLQALKKRTTLVVAHRLTTVRNADAIAVISGGGVAELGKHDELVKKQDGIYAALYKMQTEHFAKA